MPRLMRSMYKNTKTHCFREQQFTLMFSICHSGHVQWCLCRREFLYYQPIISSKPINDSANITVIYPLIETSTSAASRGLELNDTAGRISKYFYQLTPFICMTILTEESTETIFADLCGVGDRVQWQGN
jgi:hypothetical protein